MLTTGLPYDMGSMDEIKNDGAIVDMSNINFPGIPEERIYKTTFIFLRNTGFNVILDFSKCDFDRKEKFLLAYLNENIDVVQNEFAITYVSILNRMIGSPTIFECILTLEEIDTFIERNKELLSKVLSFMMSLPIFALYYFSLNNEAYTVDDIEKCDDDLISSNIYHIVSTPEYVSLFGMELNDIVGKYDFNGPKFYTKIFTGENIDLLTAVEKLPFFSILHGLCNLNSEDWNGFLENFESFKNGIKEE